MFITEKTVFPLTIKGTKETKYQGLLLQAQCMIIMVLILGTVSSKIINPSLLHIFWALMNEYNIGPST